MKPEDFKRKLTAILSADVVGYSRLMGNDEASTVKTLETYKGVMFSLIKQHRGRVVDYPGDNLLAEFGSVVDAVQCAVSIQKELQTRNADLPENRRMVFRIGINLGDVIEEKDRIYGDGVNIAARLEALADPGGICVSKTAFDHIESKLPLGYEFLGEQTVKNIAKPVSAYRVLMETRVVDTKTKGKFKAAPFSLRKSVLYFLLITILLIVSVLFWDYYHRKPSIVPVPTESAQVTAAQKIKEAPITIAVLPFVNLSPDPDQDYFVDGLSEEIINSLAQIPDLGVTGRTSSFTFKGSNKKTQDIANELGVDHILEGSVRKAENMIRITAQLIRAADDLHLWSKTYDREFKDIFAIQKEIATAVVQELKAALGFSGAFKQLGGTDNAKAYEYYLIARGLIGQGSGDNIDSVILEQNLIDSAIALDPEFALAWIRKAAIHNYYGFFKSAKSAVAERNIALKAINKAIELEPELALGYYYLGSIKTESGDFTGGELAIQKVFNLETEPFSEPEASVTAGYHYWPVGHLKKGFEVVEKSRLNDPLYPSTRQHYIAGLAFLGDTRRAEEEYKRIKSSVGDNQIDNMYITLIRLGSKDTLSPNDIIYSNPIFDAAKRNLDSPREGLSELRKLYASDDLHCHALNFISLWAAYFDDPEFALDALERAVTLNTVGLKFVWSPAMKEVRQLPGFKEFMKKIGLVDYWEKYGWPDLCRPIGHNNFECD